MILNYANELPKQGIMQICEAGSRVLTLGAAARCGGSAAAAALREFLPALVLFNYNTTEAGPEV